MKKGICRKAEFVLIIAVTKMALPGMHSNVSVTSMLCAFNQSTAVINAQYQWFVLT